MQSTSRMKLSSSPPGIKRRTPSDSRPIPLQRIQSDSEERKHDADSASGINTEKRNGKVFVSLNRAKLNYTTEDRFNNGPALASNPKVLNYPALFCEDITRATYVVNSRLIKVNEQISDDDKAQIDCVQQFQKFLNLPPARAKRVAMLAHQVTITGLFLDFQEHHWMKLMLPDADLEMSVYPSAGIKNSRYIIDTDNKGVVSIRVQYRQHSFRNVTINDEEREFIVLPEGTKAFSRIGVHLLVDTHDRVTIVGDLHAKYEFQFPSQSMSSHFDGTGAALARPHRESAARKSPYSPGISTLSWKKSSPTKVFRKILEDGNLLFNDHGVKFYLSDEQTKELMTVLKRLNIYNHHQLDINPRKMRAFSQVVHAYFFQRNASPKSSSLLDGSSGQAEALINQEPESLEMAMRRALRIDLPQATGSETHTQLSSRKLHFSEGSMPHLTPSKSTIDTAVGDALDNLLADASHEWIIEFLGGLELLRSGLTAALKAANLVPDLHIDPVLLTQCILDVVSQYDHDLGAPDGEEYERIANAVVQQLVGASEAPHEDEGDGE